VNAINALHLPRYGLGQYVQPRPKPKPTPAEEEQLQNLGRAGKRLMGFCRTNLFKRLESSGEAFLLSLERHIARNCVFLHALENNLPLPIGTQNADTLDEAPEDLDFEGDADALGEALHKNARAIYDAYATRKNNFRWIRADLFLPQLAAHLRADNAALGRILKLAGEWEVARDAKFARLVELLSRTHPNEKVLIFSQFADTVYFLERELKTRGIAQLAAATGQSSDPTEIARRFSPASNSHTVRREDEVRVLVATDVLSEGQNLQDAHIIVNYDLPWAIIRLIQRAGRVDRIGQKAPEILCYSFLPADGVEKIIQLRSRLLERLGENADVVGTDERFFEDEARRELLDLYHEKSDLAGDDGEGEVDLPSRAYAIWKSAIEADPKLEDIISRMPDKSNAAREADLKVGPRGALVYTRLNDDTDAMLWLDEKGEVITTGQWTILQAAACNALTPGLEPDAAHHELVSAAVTDLAQSHRQTSINLGRATGARYKAYGILSRFYETHKGSLNLYAELGEISTKMQQTPFSSAANTQINAQLRLNANDAAICHLLIDLHKRGALFPAEDDNGDDDEPRLVCSIALV
jgi:Helicase conserved C-terminal domain